MTKLNDIALKAATSVSTVSRVLNEDPTLSVSGEKRALILKIARELNYETPKSRKQKKTTCTIGLIHWFSREQETADTYYLSIRLGIEKACHHQNILLEKSFSGDSDPLPRAHEVEGVIALGKFRKDFALQLIKLYKNVVFVDSSPATEDSDSVVVDFKEAMLKATNYINDLKINKVGYIGGREYIGNLALGERREEVFREYYNNKFNDYIFVGDFSLESGYKKAIEAIESKKLPEAFIIASDAMALGALRAFHEKGIKIPDDLSLISFNDIPESRYSIPPLTTVRIHQEFMGYEAVSLILERIKDKRRIAKRITIATELIIRNSTKKPI